MEVNMEEELENLKKDLRSLVVSSPTPVNVQILLSDYRKMIGGNVPVGKFGYQNLLDLLKDKFTDSFVVEDDSPNPFLTLIVPDTIKHINKFVSKQKLQGKFKYLGRRRSVQTPQVSSLLTGVSARPTAYPAKPVPTCTRASPAARTATPVSTYTWTPPTASSTSPVATCTWASAAARTATPVATRAWSPPTASPAPPVATRAWAPPTACSKPPLATRTPAPLVSRTATMPVATRTNAPPTASLMSSVSTCTTAPRMANLVAPVTTCAWASLVSPVDTRTNAPPTANFMSSVSMCATAPRMANLVTLVTTSARAPPVARAAPPVATSTTASRTASPVSPVTMRTAAPRTASPVSLVTTHVSVARSRFNPIEERRLCASTTSTASTESSRGSPTSTMQRLSLLSAALRDEEMSSTSSTLDSGERHRDPLQQMGERLGQLLRAHPKGIWCMELMGLYKKEYGRELQYERWSCSVIGLVRRLAGVVRVQRFHPTGDWLLSHVDCPPARHLPHNCAECSSSCASLTQETWDPEDALPYVPYEEGVFPHDCMGRGDTIPELQLPLRRGDMLDLQVTELYSPSHLWVMPLGPDHSAALDAIMDDMTVYYESEEGSSRWLAPGAAQVGHFCAGRYGWQWHRCLIVQRIDSDTVKVRHVDYGTVDTVGTSELRPLLKGWGELPAQALRARMCGVRPCGSATRWPLPARAALLQLVSNRSLVGVVLAEAQRTLALYLVDTATALDVYLHDTMVERGHADRAPAPAPAAPAPAAAPAAPCAPAAAATDDWYERYPTFEALESGDTLSLAELQELSRLGMEPDFVPRYRAHVPPLSWARAPAALPPHLRHMPPPPGYERIQPEH